MSSLDNKLIEIKTLGNVNDGYLSFFESNRDITFDIKRIYYIHDVPVGKERGMHAHKDLNQLLWCPYGSIDIVLDNGYEKKMYKLNHPNMGLIVGNGVWRTMRWNIAGSVLCVAASNYYDENDYIRDYKEFRKLVKEGYWE